MKILLIVLAALAAVVFILWGFLLRCRRKNPAWRVLKRYRYAHRGLHNKPTVPENSLAAFRAAVEHGLGAELDVHLLADGNLAVIHDSSLKRTAGADVEIEDLTAEDLKKYPLEESTEIIPLLDEVLPLFEGTTPLVIEVKVARGNADALCQTLAKKLDGYKGDYCMESFDPRAVRWFRVNRPRVCRGQLAENFFRSHDNDLPWLLRFAGTNLLSSCWTQPDFIAYKFEDRKNWSLRLCRLLWKPVELSWTIRSQEDLDTAEREGKLPIFEKFIPKEANASPREACPGQPMSV